jgi:hypothetical protein
MNKVPPIFIEHGRILQARFDGVRYSVSIDFETKEVLIWCRVPIPPSGPIPKDELVGKGEWEGTWDKGRIINRTGSLRADHFDRAEAQLQREATRDRKAKN